MAEVVCLDSARLSKRARGALMHPALRWVSDGDPYAHRRTSSGATVCGLPGPLTVSEPTEWLCRGCYTVPVAASS